VQGFILPKPKQQVNLLITDSVEEHWTKYLKLTALCVQEQATAQFKE